MLPKHALYQLSYTPKEARRLAHGFEEIAAANAAFKNGGTGGSRTHEPPKGT